MTPSLILVRYSVMSKAHIMLIILINSIVIISTTPPTTQRYPSNPIHLKHHGATSISDGFVIFYRRVDKLFNMADISWRNICDWLQLRNLPTQKIEYSRWRYLFWPEIFFFLEILFQVDGPFRWLDGSAWDFTNWDDGEPDRKSVGRTHHECVFVCLISSHVRWHFLTTVHCYVQVCIHG